MLNDFPKIQRLSDNGWVDVEEIYDVASAVKKYRTDLLVARGYDFRPSFYFDGAHLGYFGMYYYYGEDRDLPRICLEYINRYYPYGVKPVLQMGIRYDFSEEKIRQILDIGEKSDWKNQLFCFAQNHPDWVDSLCELSKKFNWLTSDELLLMKLFSLVGSG